MRDAALAVIREIGVETGGSNIQFAVNPENGRMIVIEMNPRVSRSSALASKATGFPIAKIATKLAIGYTLDEIPNDITRETPACFEPTIDYVVTKVPRFAFEKFPGADDELGPQMKSVGEVMAIGRTFKESLGKALRSLEIGRWGFDLDKAAAARRAASAQIVRPGPDRLWQLAEALRAGLTRRRGVPAHQDRPVVPAHTCAQMVDEDEAARIDGASAGAAVLDDAAALRAAQAARHVGPPAHEADRHHARSRCARRASSTASARSTSASTPAPPSSRRRRRTCTRPTRSASRSTSAAAPTVENEARPTEQEEDRHPRRRPQPHRPGHRVRLLLRARGAGAARGRLRDHHGQLQPGDGVDRLRHLRPAVLRAAHARGRAGDHRRREARGRDRAVRRPDAAAAGGAAAERGRQAARHQRRRHRSRRGSRALRRAAARSWTCARRPGAPRTASTRRARSPSASATR